MQKYNSKFKSDLIVRCYRFSLALIEFIDGLPKSAVCKVISEQLLRSGTSIGANLVEAKGSSSRLEFKRFHEIALKSANETKYWLGLIRDSKRGSRAKANLLLDETVEIANMIASGVLRLKGKR